MITIDGAEDEIVAQTRYHLEGIVSRNRLLMRRRRIPRLYESGVRYQLEQWKLADGADVHHFADCLEVLERRFAACHNLCTYRLAELREADPENEQAYGLDIDWRLLDGRVIRSGGLHRALEVQPGEVVALHHVRLFLSNGAKEDCSRRLAR